MANTRDRNIDSSRREDSRKGMVDRCEVIMVHPHKAPFPGDVDFNVVDVQLIDRVRQDGEAPILKRTRLNCLQHYHGLFQGNPWNPRIGDMVLVYWLSEREGIVIGTVPSIQQEPVCRSQATPEHQEIICKRAPWEEPGKNKDGNYVIFPKPKHPDCFKWWPKTRDYITIHDCPLGHGRPECDICHSLDSLQSGSWWKVFSDISPTAIDKPRRVKFHHHCGSVFYFDEDGRIILEQRVGGDPGSKAHYAIRMYPPNGNDADEHGPIAADYHYIIKGSLIRFYKDGMIKITSAVDPSGNTGSSQMMLGPDGHCWLWDIKDDTYIEMFPGGAVKIKGNPVTLDGDVIVKGTLNHGICSCLGAQDFSTFSMADSGEKLTVDTSKVSCSGLSCADKASVAKDMIEINDCRISLNVEVSACNGGSCGCCGVSNTAYDDILCTGGYKLLCSCEDGEDGLQLMLKLLNDQTVVASDSCPISQGVRYSCDLKKEAGSAAMAVYSAGQKVADLAIQNANIAAFRYLYGLSSMYTGEADKTISATVSAVSVN